MYIAKFSSNSIHTYIALSFCIIGKILIFSLHKLAYLSPLAAYNTSFVCDKESVCELLSFLKEFFNCFQHWMATILSQTGKTFSFDKNFPLDTGSQTKQAEPSLQLASLLSDQPFKEMVTPKK